MERTGRADALCFAPVNGSSKRVGGGGGLDVQTDAAGNEEEH